MLVKIEFTFEMFRHPLSKHTGTKISDQKCPKLLATTLCQTSSPGVTIGHAVTLYQVDDTDYIFKNTAPNEPEIRIPITRQTWSSRECLQLLLISFTINLLVV